MPSGRRHWIHAAPILEVLLPRWPETGPSVRAQAEACLPQGWGELSENVASRAGRVRSWKCCYINTLPPGGGCCGLSQQMGAGVGLLEGGRPHPVKNRPVLQRWAHLLYSGSFADSDRRHKSCRGVTHSLLKETLIVIIETVYPILYAICFT